MHWTGNRGKMYKTVQINCFTKVFCVTAYPGVSTSVPLTYVWAFGFVGCILFFKKVCCVPSCFWVLWPTLFSVPEKPLEHTVFMGTPNSWILIIPNQSSPTNHQPAFTRNSPMVSYSLGCLNNSYWVPANSVKIPDHMKNHGFTVWPQPLLKKW